MIERAGKESAEGVAASWATNASTSETRRRRISRALFGRGSVAAGPGVGVALRAEGGWAPGVADGGRDQLSWALGAGEPGGAAGVVGPAGLRPLAAAA